MFLLLKVTLGVVFLLGNGYCDEEAVYHDSAYVKDRIRHISNDMYNVLQLLPETVNFIVGGIVAAPFMVVHPLAKYAQYSSGLSREHINNYLKLDYDEIRNISLRNLDTLVPNTANMTFIAFSKTFVQQGLNLSKAYVEQTRRDDGLDISHIDFRFPEKAVREINHWASEATKGAIDYVVDQRSIQQRTEVLTVNCMYYKSIWKKSFRNEDYPTFFLGDHVYNTRILYFMTQLDYFYYKRSAELNADIVRVPFYDQDFEFILINPIESSQYGFVLNVTKTLQENTRYLEDALEKSEQKLVELSMPEVIISSSIDLKATLKVLGVADIFDSRLANLEAMFEHGYNGHISSMVQNVIIALQYKGVEAAHDVVPDLTLLKKDSGDIKVVKVRASRPFVFQLRFRGYLLFMGSYEGTLRL